MLLGERDEKIRTQHHIDRDVVLIDRETRSLHTHLAGVANARVCIYTHMHVGRETDRPTDAKRREESINSVINTQANNPTITPPLCDSKNLPKRRHKSEKETREEEEEKNTQLSSMQQQQQHHLFIYNQSYAVWLRDLYMYSSLCVLLSTMLVCYLSRRQIRFVINEERHRI